jgi:hypothetical protein
VPSLTTGYPVGALFKNTRECGPGVDHSKPQHTGECIAIRHQLSHELLQWVDTDGTMADQANTRGRGAVLRDILSRQGHPPVQEKQVKPDHAPSPRQMGRGFLAIQHQRSAIRPGSTHHGADSTVAAAGTVTTAPASATAVDDLGRDPAPSQGGRPAHPPPKPFGRGRPLYDTSVIPGQYR